MKIFIFLFLCLSLTAFAQGPTDILFDRTADFKQREEVADKLSVLGLKKPLPVQAAVAEACYGIDLCAQLSPLDPSCDMSDPKDGFPDLSSSCYPTFFRKEFSCSETVEKQSLSTMNLAGRLFVDIVQIYRNYLSDYLMTKFSEFYQVDLRKLAKDPAAMLEFQTNHPDAFKHISTTINESVGMGAYTLDCYSIINPMLYRHDEKDFVRYFNLIKSVINTMSVYPEYKKMVNRGVSLPKSVLAEHHKIGNIVCYDAFISTAAHDPERDFGSDPRNVFLSGKCTQRLYISYDSGAVGGKYISAASTHKYEDEVLFEPGSCFRIDKVYPRTDEVTDDEDDEDDEDEEECDEGEHYNFEMTLVR